MMSKVELQRQIKMLRGQMARLEASSQEREDKLMEMIERIEPFFSIMAESQQLQLLGDLDLDRKDVEPLEMGERTQCG